MSEFFKGIRLKDVVVLVAVLVGFFLIKKVFDFFRSGEPLGGDQEKPKTLPHPDSHYSLLAEQVDEAMKGFGTDEQALFDLFSPLSLDEIRAVSYFYGNRYGALIHQGKKNMSAWLKDELKDSPYWYEKIGSILRPAGIGW